MNIQKTLLIFLLWGVSFYSIAQSQQAIQQVVEQAYQEFKDVQEGKNADYIKELAKVDPSIFGIVMVDIDGNIYSAGDNFSQVSIQSVSKAFVLSLVLNESGPEVIKNKVGANATGFPFNSIIAMEINRESGINSMVNAGAIATTSLVNGATADDKWNAIVKKLSEFAGRPLEVDEPVYISEAGDNQRNVAQAQLLKAYDKIYFDADQSVDIYTRQCALSVHARDLAIMAATLASGGKNPITNSRVVSTEAVSYTLPVMATAGLYENSGKWLYQTGLPGKSGVGGALIAVVPGKFGIAVVSPPLDEAGNSVKGQLAINYIVEKLNLNPYLVESGN
ncbi:glutaminase A [Mongoliitalea daihaiensis]|uniref:glutaminase A n=1 Tax=Mongoliitalea daihaiensis TaxID=2782006 RepID=UPI001F166322|nr:glutaminase A [Mongoliitalea daihaiensis]UJP64968.1 glutaminase A [Mongoliitalea daihaiensis]